MTMIAPNMEAIRVSIATERTETAELLERLVQSDPELELAGVAEDGAGVTRLIRRSDPDLVILQARLPDMDVFEVVEAIGVEKMPSLVLVTRDSEVAMEAFELAAVDCLGEPVDPERLESALERAKNRIELEEVARRREQLAAVLRTLASEDVNGLGARDDNGRSRLMVKRQGKVRFVPVKEVRWMEAAGNYVRVHADESTEMVRSSLTAMEGRLDPDRFVRIHRSTIVNLDFVREMRHWSSGEYLVELADGTELKMSRSYRDEVLGRWE